MSPSTLGIMEAPIDTDSSPGLICTALATASMLMVPPTKAPAIIPVTLALDVPGVHQEIPQERPAGDPDAGGRRSRP